MNIKENFYEKLQMIREASFSPAFYGKSKPNNDIRGSGVETQPSGAKLTTSSKIKTTKHSGDTTMVDKAKGAVERTVGKPLAKAMGLDPKYGLKQNVPTMNQDNPKLDFGNKKK